MTIGGSRPSDAAARLGDIPAGGERPDEQALPHGGPNARAVEGRRPSEDGIAEVNSARFSLSHFISLPTLCVIHLCLLVDAVSA